MSNYPLSVAKEELSQLIDKALHGEMVTILREGKPVAELRPSARAPASAPKPMTRANIEWLRARRDALPPLGGDAVAIIREMRDEERLAGGGFDGRGIGE